MAFCRTFITFISYFKKLQYKKIFGPGRLCWLINDVLKIQEGKIVTHDLLMEIGIDSVEITKKDEENFSIDFKEIGANEDFTARE